MDIRTRIKSLLHWLNFNFQRKIKLKEFLKGADGVDVEVDSEQVLYVVIEPYFIVIIFKNSTHQAFPLHDSNLDKAHRIKMAVRRFALE